MSEHETVIPYLTGFTIKPASISGIGVVTFTDGTNEVIPNQLQCESYGYTYNKSEGTCSVFSYNTNLNRSFDNANNSTKGSQNVTETGTNNTLITVNSYLNGITGSYFVVPENTAIMFEADILAVRVGGEGEGTVGDYKTWIQTGVVVNRSGDLAVDSSTISHSHSGSTGGWDAESTVSGTNYIMSVEGVDDNSIEWVSNIRFTQLKTGVTL